MTKLRKFRQPQYADKYEKYVQDVRKVHAGQIS